ncbi:MAG: InlB B-repeat-containing protein, partial [Eubacterium sp.]|nr:InlB B-repeat-containing protein [Candidatus Colimonas fimequi]
MKTKFRRGIALALAIALVITTLSWTAGNTLRASDDEEAYTQETHVAQEAKPEKQEKAEKPQEKPQEQPQVQEKQEISLDENDKADSQPQHADKEDNAAEVSGEEAAEEEAAVEEEVIEEEETVLMPAATFSKTASNGIHVSVSAPEGALPEGTTMSVSAVGKDRALSMIQGEVPDAVDAKGVDISFHYEGKEIEPEKNVKVTLKGANVEGSDFNIYHVEDSGNVELMTSNATSSGGTFKSDEFSVYIIEASAPEEEEEQDTISVTVRFLTTEKVAISDSYSTDVELEDGKYSFSYDGVPSEDGMTPALSGDADGHFSFSGNTIHATIPENEINSEREYTVDIIYSSQPADFTVKYLFQTMDGEGYEEDAAYPAVTVQGEVGHMTNSEASVVEVEGFIAPTEDDIDEQVVAADGSTVVELKYIRNSYRVVYNTNGGSYIPAIKGGYGAEVQLYKKDEKTCNLSEHTHTAKPSGTPTKTNVNNGATNGCYKAVNSGNSRVWTLNCGKTEHKHSEDCQYSRLSPVPTRTGYTFAGWYLDAACTQLAPETATLTSD